MDRQIKIADRQQDKWIDRQINRDIKMIYRYMWREIKINKSQR